MAADIKDYVKIPHFKYMTYVVTAGAVVFVVSQLVKSIIDGQLALQNKKINEYRLAEYTATYGGVEGVKDFKIVKN